MPTVYTEGWGLYSERLGLDLGLYGSDLYSMFGYYAVGSLVRACRLVVDTGKSFLSPEGASRSAPFYFYFLFI